MASSWVATAMCLASRSFSTAGTSLASFRGDSLPVWTPLATYSAFTALTSTAVRRFDVAERCLIIDGADQAPDQRPVAAQKAYYAATVAKVFADTNLVASVTGDMLNLAQQACKATFEDPTVEKGFKTARKRLVKASAARCASGVVRMRQEPYVLAPAARPGIERRRHHRARASISTAGMAHGRARRPFS